MHLPHNCQKSQILKKIVGQHKLSAHVHVRSLTSLVMNHVDDDQEVTVAAAGDLNQRCMSLAPLWQFKECDYKACNSICRKRTSDERFLNQC